MENIFTERDFEQIKHKGISIEKIEKHSSYWRGYTDSGFSHLLAR